MEPNRAAKLDGVRRWEMDEPEINSKVEWETIMALFMEQLGSGLRDTGDRTGPRGGPPDPTVKNTDRWAPDLAGGQHIWLCDSDKMSGKWKQMTEQSLEG